MRVFVCCFFFFKIYYIVFQKKKKKKKKKNRNTFRVSNGLDPDQDRRWVGPDLGLNCLQRLSADDF